MNGTTSAGGRVSVFVDEESGPLVFIGADNKKPRAMMQSIPLSPKEARNLANWLNGAADQAERLAPEAAEGKRNG